MFNFDKKVTTLKIRFNKLSEKNKKTVTQIALVLGVLVLGLLLFKMLVSMRRPPAKKERQIVAALVNAQTVHTEQMQMIVQGYGTVSAKAEIKVVPQVSGRVVECHEDFVNGGFFKAGQSLITIDPRDYQLALESAEAGVAAAQVALDREQAEAQVASQQWKQLHPDSEPSSPLVLRQPQIREANAQLKAARAKLVAARLNLERTVISMPFDGRVADESVDVGQYLTPGQSIATVYDTAAVEIVVPLEDRELAWFDVPLLKTNPASSSANSKALVKADFGGVSHTWSGQVVRTEGRIDPTSRMVNVVVEVADPFEVTDGQPPLVPGIFVEIAIEGKKLDKIIAVPRYAVHNVDEVWAANGDQLRIQKVKIVRSDKDYAYVSSGIEDGDVIITSPIDTVTDGMKIRTKLNSSPDKNE